MEESQELKKYYQDKFKNKQLVETDRPSEFWGAIYAGVPIVVTDRCIYCDMLSYNFGQDEGHRSIRLDIDNASEFIRESGTKIVCGGNYCDSERIVTTAGALWAPYSPDITSVMPKETLDKLQQTIDECTNRIYVAKAQAKDNLLKGLESRLRG